MAAPGEMVYVLADRADHVKIGWTAKGLPGVYVRCSQCSTGNPHGVRVLGWTEGTRALESALHRMFAAARMNGEWFYVEDDQRLEMLYDHLALGDDLTTALSRLEVCV